MGHDTIICRRCGIEIKRTNPAQKYCKPCAKEAIKENKRRREKAKKEKAKPTSNNIILSDMAAEAARHHMTYGKYVAMTRR